MAALSLAQALTHPNVHLVDHPLAQLYLSEMRDKRAEKNRFRKLMQKCAPFLIAPATFGLKTQKRGTITTPLEIDLPALELDGRIAIVVVERAGNRMMEAAEDILPRDVPIWFFGARRDESTLQTIVYSDKIPLHSMKYYQQVLVIDPMLATGNTAVTVLTRLKERGASQVAFLGILGCPEGITQLTERFPDVPIYLLAVDPRLNERGYIEPGLGDAGDRSFGTVNEEFDHRAA